MNKKLILEGQKIAGCLLGTFIYALGVNLFVVPAGLYTSGLLGICQVIRTWLVDYLHFSVTDFDIAGIIYYLLNIPLLIFAMKRAGKNFLIKTLISVTFMTIFMAIIPITSIVKDTMTACVVGGIITGIGTGMTLRMSASLGGIDAAGILLIRWKKDFSVGKINLLVNLLLYGMCLLMFNIEIVIYSLIYAVVYSVAIDKVHIQNINVEVKIITKADTEILEKEVFGELGRGITKWHSLGAYTGEESQVLYILLSKYEVIHLKNIVHNHDPNAFVVINEGVLVDGNYLKKL